MKSIILILAAGGIILAAVLGGILLKRRRDEKMRRRMDHLQKMESLGRLAGGVAHDFNNMLAGIQGAAEFIKLQEKDNEKYGKYIDIIIRTCQRAAYLTSQLLVFAREKEKEFSTIEIKDLIDDAVCLLKHGVPSGIEIETRIAEGDYCIEGNKNLIESLILNLGLNARDAIGKNGKIILSAMPRDLGSNDIAAMMMKVCPGKYLELVVSDNGKGISDEVFEKIFEPFFTTKEEGKGTGLGLPAVYGIVREHGGTMKIETSAGGTSFRVYFPLSCGHKCSVCQATEIGNLYGRILILDDEAILRELLKDILNSLGCEVTICKTAQELFDVYSPEKFDLVMLDLIMPKIKGTEVYAQLKEINPNVKVLFMSGYSEDNDAEEIMKRDPASGFIKKPCGIAELRDKLVKML